VKAFAATMSNFEYFRKPIINLQFKFKMKRRCGLILREIFQGYESSWLIL